MSEMKTPLRILMVGPGRNVMGGISTVVNSYYDLKLDEIVELRYIASMEDGNKLKKLMVAIMAYIQFHKYVRQFDVVHIHMAAQASFVRKSLFVRAAKYARKKVIIHQHSADFDVFFHEKSDSRKQREIKKVFSLADRVIVLSEEWAEFFGEYICDPEKITVLHNGVIIPQYQKKDYTDHNVLYLGRLGARKGSYDLLKAIPEILKEVPDAVFFLGGDGEVAQSKKVIDENDLAEHVKLLGWVQADEKEEYMKKSSIFVLPSYHEGMPMAVLEAMSYGLATVASNAGGIPQIIENGKNGIRIEAGDIHAIETELIKLLKNAERKKEIGMAGRRRIVEEFSAKNNISKLIEIYTEVQK